MLIGKEGKIPYVIKDFNLFMYDHLFIIYIVENSKIMRDKSPFMIYADFESILVPENNGKQNPKLSSTNKYRKHIACSYDYKSV